MCVAPPTHVGPWLMTVLLGQPFEYYYYKDIIQTVAFTYTRYKDTTEGQILAGHLELLICICMYVYVILLMKFDVVF